MVGFNTGPVGATCQACGQRVDPLAFACRYCGSPLQGLPAQAGPPPAPVVTHDTASQSTSRGGTAVTVPVPPILVSQPTFAPAVRQTPPPAATLAPPPPPPAAAVAPPPPPLPDDDEDGATVVIDRRPPRPPAEWRLRLPDGGTVDVDETMLLGRRPTASAGPSGARLVILDDPERTVSRSHLVVAPNPGAGVLITDVSTSNGVVRVGSDGTETVLEPGVATAIAAPCLLVLGLYRIAVEPV